MKEYRQIIDPASEIGLRHVRRQEFWMWIDSNRIGLLKVGYREMQEVFLIRSFKKRHTKGKKGPIRHKSYW
jgi:hypothetical protein